jgi:hypothetical protein
MAQTMSEPDSTAAHPASRRYRPAQVIAAVGLATALVILAVGASSRLFPGAVVDAPAGDRAKHGHGDVRG